MLCLQLGAGDGAVKHAVPGVPTSQALTESGDAPSPAKPANQQPESDQSTNEKLESAEPFNEKPDIVAADTEV